METNKNNEIAFLEKLLATEYIMNLKIKNFHRNVEGESFYGLHTFFEQMYTLSATNIDEIAERIRKLWAYTKGSYKEYLTLTIIEECSHSHNGNANSMLKELIADREKMLPFMNEVFDSMSQSTQNLLTDMIAQYEKDVWMMKAMIK